MTQHEYTYDIKMYALIRVRAESIKAAQKLAWRAADIASLEFPIAEELLNSSIIEATIIVDDEGGGLLIEIDGEEVDSCGNPY